MMFGHKEGLIYIHRFVAIIQRKLPYSPPFPKGPFIMEVRKYLSRLLFNQINPKLRTKSFGKKSLE